MFFPFFGGEHRLNYGQRGLHGWHGKTVFFRDDNHEMKINNGDDGMTKHKNDGVTGRLAGNWILEM
jgi:hypothetical protein